MKHLIVQFVDDKNFYIVHQSHKESQFGTFEIRRGEYKDTKHDTGVFCSDGFFLHSACEIEVRHNGLYVKGSYDFDYPSRRITAPSLEWKRKLLDAVDKYNKHYK